MPEPPRNRRQTVGIVTALAAEFDAMRKLLDRPGSKMRLAGEGCAIYVLGEIPSADRGKPHRVVLALLTEPGNSAAARACANLVRTFPAIRLLVMVGTAAGVPNVNEPEQHVRLGDVVVGKDGIIEYDYVDDRSGRLSLRGAPVAPSRFLLNHALMLRAEERNGERPWEQLIRRVQRDSARFARPPDESDVLHTSGSEHRVVAHPDRARSGHRPGQPKIHYGLIGSGNTAFSNIQRRDELARKYGFLALEMEGGGLTRSATGEREYLAIRGISDYGDEYRTKEWRDYASLSAAAYTRALFAHCPRVRPRTPSRRRVPIFGAIAAVVVIVVLVIAIPIFTDDPPRQITGRTAVDNARGMANGTVATVRIPSPPDRRYLALTVHLANTSQVGDCVHSADLELVPRVDGVARPAVPGRPGRETTLDLANAEHSAEVLVSVSMPDVTCRADLTVTKAVLHD